jgi:hypothetical protein
MGFFLSLARRFSAETQVPGADPPLSESGIKRPLVSDAVPVLIDSVAIVNFMALPHAEEGLAEETSIDLH